jgi:hypothetical protein
VGCGLRRERIGRKFKGAEKGFGCWAESIRRPKMREGLGEKKRFLFIFRII